MTLLGTPCILQQQAATQSAILMNDSSRLDAGLMRI
jgi:hypothetical protein